MTTHRRSRPLRRILCLALAAMALGLLAVWGLLAWHSPLVSDPEAAARAAPESVPDWWIDPPPLTDDELSPSKVAACARAKSQST